MKPMVLRTCVLAAASTLLLSCTDSGLAIEVDGRLESLSFRQVGDTLFVFEELELFVGQVARILAYGHDGSGSNMGQTEVSWSSSAPSVASVSDGEVVGLSPGFTEISASASGARASLPTVVYDTVSGGGGTPSNPQYTNEPAGFVRVAETDWGDVSSGWRLTNVGEPADRIVPFSTLSAGLTAPPVGGTSVLSAQLDAGLGPGADHVLAGLPSPGTATTFVGFHSMFDPNYVNCSFQNKFFYFWLDGVGNGGDPWGWFWLDLHPTGQGDEQDWALRFQGHWLDRNRQGLEQLHVQNQDETTTVTYGQWDKVEILWEPPTPGISNGRVTVWHQGQRIIVVDDIGLPEGASGRIGGTGKGLDFISTYGGGCTPERNMNFYVAHTYVSAPG